MSVNVKLGKNTINGVESVKLEDATTTGVYHEFSLSPSGMYRVTFTVDDDTYSIIDVLQGNSIIAPKQPTKSGYQFISWQISGVNVSFPYTPNADTTITAYFVAGETCLVQGLGSSSPSNVTFTKSSGWSDTYQTVTINGNTFKKIPTMYRKVNAVINNQITSFTIANAQIDSDYKPYPCFIKEDGVSIMPYILIGVSCSNSDVAINSISGNTTVGYQQIGAARTSARALGEGYQITDWMIHKLWQDLIICAMETVNTNSGNGINTDALGIYWGTTDYFVDGVIVPASNGSWYFSYKPSEYVSLSSLSDPFPSSYNSSSYGEQYNSGEEIQKLGYDSNNPFFNYPSVTISNSSYNTYYCDSSSAHSYGKFPVRCSVGSTGASSGAFSCRPGVGWVDGASAVRLCYRPISE